jgi:hypothetical protein
MEAVMRSLKLAFAVIVVALAAYAASFLIVPPNKTIASAPAPSELFSLQILRTAQETPEASYDTN